MNVWKFDARWANESHILLFQELNFVFVLINNPGRIKDVKENDLIVIVDYSNKSNMTEIKGIGIADGLSTIGNISTKYNNPQFCNIEGVKIKEVIWNDLEKINLGTISSPFTQFHKIKKDKEQIEILYKELKEKTKKMKYWTFKHQPGQKANENACLEFVKKAIRLNSALMQYEYERQDTGKVTQNWNKVSEIKEGDYIFLRGNVRIYAVGKAIKPRKKADERLNAEKIIEKRSHGGYISGEHDGVIHFDDREVFYEELTSEEEDNWGQRIDVESWMYYNPIGIDAKSQDFYVNGENEFGVIKQLTEESATNFINQLKEKFMGNEIKVLLSNKNIVLTGAPGTGKTYLAKEMALKILFGKDREDLLSENEKMKLQKQLAFVQFHPSYDYTDFIEGLRPYKEEDKEMGFKLTNGIFKEFCKNALIAFKEDENMEQSERRKFVFVIDEINRGEISKIFGELFFSLDPGYRGEKGEVKTQYHNINENVHFVDAEKKSFYIPENVYVIGTMNDIDRSVESFDFAMRRRFAWIEIKPEDRTSMWDGQIQDFKVPAALKMKALNEIISENANLGSHYQIGPAYFLKLKEYEGDSQNRFNNLWQNHLEILLKEYLRGLPESKEELTKLEKAYNGTK